MLNKVLKLRTTRPCKRLFKVYNKNNSKTALQIRVNKSKEGKTQCPKNFRGKDLV